MTDRQDPVRLIIWTVLILLGAAVLWSALLGWMGWGWNGHWGGMMAFGPLFMLLPVILIVVLIYALTDQARPRTEPGPRMPAQRSPDGPDARTVAERRYAAGEITRDEFLSIKDDLEGRHEP